MRKKESLRIEHRTEVIHQGTNEYTLVNAYTHKASWEQLITFVLFLGIVILHSVFITPSLAHQSSPFPWVLLAISYTFLLLILVDYLYLTCNDPADRLLTAKDY